MDNSMHHDHQAVCTVTQMAKKLSLSRPRFYQLMTAGVFPPPVYCLVSRMPLYPLDLQEICFRIRETGIGVNGQLVRFYDRREVRKPDSELRQAGTILREMCLSVTATQIRKALGQLKLRGTGQKPTDPEVIRSLFNYFHGTRQNDV